MHHLVRALFALIGGLVLTAAFVPALRIAAASIGLASLLSFMLLALPPGAHGAAIQRVFWVDVVASLMLAVAVPVGRGLGRPSARRPG